MAQEKEQTKDSATIYNRIERYSEKRKFTKKLHKLIFRSNKKKPPKVVQKSKRDYKNLEGKVIRNIVINTKDPFGFSFKDSTETANSWLEKTGNQVHIKSKKFAIRNFLLLDENETLDTLLLDESARLLRSQKYIREVEITAHPVKKSDSVDVRVTVLDSWSLNPQGAFSTSENKLTLKEYNIVGTGHQVNFSFANRLDDGKNAYYAEYRIPNFKNTFIKAAVRYKSNFNEFYNKSVFIEREFYSPFTRWAAGIYVDEQYREEELLDPKQEYVAQNFKYISQDYWVGHSYPLFKGNSEKKRSTNLITSIGFLDVNYKESPNAIYDSINFFADETSYLGTVGISSRQFVQDNFIFNDGITEDVPVGRIYALTGGFQSKNQNSRLYLGARASFGNYFNWGYISSNFEIGSYFNGSKTEQTAYSFQANYFTNLIDLGERWKMRQFVKPQFIIGVNRKNSIGDRLSIDQNNRFNGIYGSDYRRTTGARIAGFNSDLTGTEKYVLELQTQFYAPWEILGFRLNPFLNYTGAVIKDTNPGSNNLFSSFGVGFIIRNNYLVFDNFQLSFSFFPEIPGQGFNLFKTNAFETEDFGFQDLQLGKPRTILFN
ncbi:hypothetical protein [Christiangramia forsetii]|uniref:Uncharacterized protein n=2 Tax=Christiangramia forsetii TaxID=411153 RepID=A0M659_CHRFK|nr:hypothetical protein [Christiangramia forsetii]GGG31324.1 hypothetical protein GCM10011532_13510 [Christiangramia forsetii]CAL68104.1 conserved hypothetical protein [Christiangramia forsetii KT0803]